MGHLINSRSTRLGWFKHWWDVWFSKNSHYAELTMSCLRMRFFLIFLFFSRKVMIKHLLLFSHFEMIKLYKIFTVKLFYYDGALEESIDDCLDYFKNQQRISKWKKPFMRNKMKKRLRRFQGEGSGNIGLNRIEIKSKPCLKNSKKRISIKYNKLPGKAWSFKFYKRGRYNIDRIAYRNAYLFQRIRVNLPQLIIRSNYQEYKPAYIDSYRNMASSHLLTYDKYLDLIKRWFVSLGNDKNNLITYDKIYILQQDEIQLLIRNFKRYINYFYSIKDSLTDISYIKIFSGIIRKFNLLGRRLDLSDKLRILLQHNNFNVSNNLISHNHWVNKFDLWRFIRRFTRIRYDAPKRFVLKDRALRWITKGIFKLGIYMDKLTRKFYYRKRMDKWGYRARYILKSCGSHNIYMRFKYLIGWKKIYNKFRFLNRRYKYHTNWFKRKGRYNKKNRFFSYISDARHEKIDFLAVKKLYHDCLKNLKIEPIFDDIKIELASKRRLAVIITHWRNLIKYNLVQYAYRRRPFNKYTPAWRKKIYYKAENREKYLSRKREQYSASDRFLWRDIMKEFWWFKSHQKKDDSLRIRSKKNNPKKVISQALALKNIARLQPIHGKKKFLSTLLHVMGRLPLDILVAKTHKSYVSKYELRIRQMETYIKKSEISMEEHRLSKIKRRREKAKKKMLADPLNKWTSEELDLYLFGITPEGQSIDSEDTESIETTNLLDTSCFDKYKKPKPDMQLSSIKGLPYRINSALKYKYYMQKWKNDRNSVDYKKKYHIATFPAKIISKLTKSLIRGKGLRLRRFLSNPDLIEDLTRNRSLALILFTAVCSKWFNKLSNSIKLGTLILYDMFRFIHILESNVGLHRYIAEVLNYLISKILLQFKIRKIKFDFFLISNNSINASFLARYIANKFRQNLSLRRVLNPLSREFRRVTHSNQYNSKLLGIERNQINLMYENRVALQRAWGNLFSACSEGFSNYLSEYYSYSFTWFSIDSINLYIWVKSIYIDDKNKFRYLSTYLTRRLNAFYITHISDINNWFINLSIFTLRDYVIDLSSHSDWGQFFNLILRHILINVVSFNNINRFAHKTHLITKIASRSYYRFLKYNYWSVNYKMWHTIKAFNYSKARQRVEVDSTNLFRGFKIHCLGRFSRRQRAKSFWLHLGMVPLNKFSTNIDYSNYTVPIKNSLISIKVWIHLAQMPDFPDTNIKTLI